MTEPKLTPMGTAATIARKGSRGREMKRKIAGAGLALASAMTLSGCINVAAPDEPIVIELNVNIRAEVLYRLAEDANNTIDENADIF